MCHKFLVLTVKKLLKSVYIYGSYRKIKTGVSLFWTTRYCMCSWGRGNYFCVPPVNHRTSLPLILSLPHWHQPRYRILQRHRAVSLAQHGFLVTCIGLHQRQFKCWNAETTQNPLIFTAMTQNHGNSRKSRHTTDKRHDDRYYRR